VIERTAADWRPAQVSLHVHSHVIDTVQCGSAARMSSITCPGTSIRGRRVTRILMLVLSVLAVPSLGPAAMQRPHCAQHETGAAEQTAHARGTHQMPEAGSSTSWESPRQHECPHCPPTECAHLAPCTTSPTATIIEASRAVIPLAVDRDPLPRLLVQPGSIHHEPPTPPPQPIS
jgi:hypothetical protein